MTPYHETQAANPSPAASALRAVMPPALPPRMAIRCGSTSPRAARCSAASRQSSESATPHWPHSAQR